MPSRKKHAKETEIVADIDAIIAEPIHFRFRGKIHTLKPMVLKEFLKFASAQSQLNQYIKEDAHKLNLETMAQAYFKVISSVCDSITIDDVIGAEQVQLAAIYQLILDMVTGQVDLGNPEKKSRKKIPLYESVEHSSLGSVQENLAGPSKPH